MKKNVSIIGGGASALMLACELDSSVFEVSIYERNTHPGRKFLVAGDGGLNLTHSENKTQFINRYTPSSFLEPALNHFSNHDLVEWMNNLGIKTYTGSSGRIFPVKSIKPAEVLAAILKQIKDNSVVFKTRHEWKGFESDGTLLFRNGDGEIKIKSDYTVFCLGGASWPVTGSKGEWLSYFDEKNIETTVFLASNCAFKIDWPLDLVSKIEGKALKNVSISCGNRVHPGEVVLTKFGIEGSGIYPLSPPIREQLAATGEAWITIDLKPSLTQSKILEKLVKNRDSNTSSKLKTELSLGQVQVQLLKSCIAKEDFLNLQKLSFHIKNLKVAIKGTAPVEEAISTTGGISLKEIDTNFELKKMPQHFAIGEMLDYDAPTGGYLLQSCFSMGNYLAHYLNKGETNF